jgi:signal transduction histidine kinase
MDKLSIPQLLSCYIKDKWKTAVCFLLTMLFFFTVCLLYQLENMQSLLYAFFLWAFSALCFVAYDFTKYVKKCRMLQIVIENMDNLSELLPQPSGLIEQQYRSIVDLLTDETNKLRTKLNLKDTDMSDYYTMWAHQIKIPISAMRLLLQSSSGASAQAGDMHSGAAPEINVSLLKEELFKIEQYVEMVLYYQRLDSITSDFLFKKYDLRDIVKQVLKKYSIFFINSGLSLHLEEFSCFVVTDEKWLAFVIGQIFSNAVKYTSRGSITIRHEDDGERVLLIIEDTGIGIRPEDLPRIFERGYTGFNGRLDKKSTGIGLYLCKQILNKLSHTIDVSSEVGRGTKVTLGFSQVPELF